MTSSSILDLDLPQLTSLLEDLGQPAYRARQVWQGIYQRQAESPDSLTDLPLELRRRLSETLTFRSFELRHKQVSSDGRTTKFLLGRSGEAAGIECVLMRYDRRRTGCISTQSGCAMGCPFCATGQMGFLRNLSSGEIVEQVLQISRDETLTNLVFMGMGEPFHNYDASLAAVDRLTDSDGLRFGARRITISTVGLIPMIRRFTDERRQVNLAVSLHAATDDLRDRLVPINRRYPIGPLLEACRDYVRITRRRLTVEWALIEQVNDGLEQARALADLVKGMLCHVNLIPLNPTRGFPGSGSDSGRAEKFAAVLRSNRIACTVRQRRGIEIAAGCGQLATETAGGTVGDSEVR